MPKLFVAASIFPSALAQLLFAASKNLPVQHTVPSCFGTCASVVRWAVGSDTDLYLLNHMDGSQK